MTPSSPPPGDRPPDAPNEDGQDAGAGGAARDGRTPVSPVAVVGIGASAGGLEALIEFVEGISEPIGAAFVVVQHLAPDRVSLTPELLRTHTWMPVTELRDQTTLERDHVYTAPPRAYVTLIDEQIRVADAPEAHVHLPIDRFLRSLADAQGERAIAVILSGSGTDGTLGLRAIAAAGGLTVVQSPETAAHEGMPTSAMATELVDLVLPVAEMPDAFARYMRHPYLQRAARPHDPEQRADIEAIVSLVRARMRHDFRGYKRNTLGRRIERRMSLMHLDDLEAYLAHLRKHPGELDALVRDLLINVTFFFRQPDAWAALEAEVIAPLVASKALDDSIRVWVPGCATGEEPYTLAMLLLEHVERAQRAPSLQVFATDVDADALGVARAGRYPASIESDVPANRLRRFFEQRAGEQFYQVRKALRDVVIFAEQNVLTDPPFSHVDLICCRNLLIYLQPEVQERVLGSFHFALQPDGALFLGSTESAGRAAPLFRPVSQRWRIFRRVAVANPPRLPRLAWPTRRLVAEGLDRAPAIRETDLARLAEHRLVEHFAPAAVLVDANLEIRYFSGAVDAYLVQRAGLPSHALLDRAREGLRVPLREAVDRAREARRPVCVPIRVLRGGDLVQGRLTAIPIRDSATSASLTLLAFEDIRDASDSTRALRHRPPPAPEPETPEQERSLVQRLEQELAITRDELQEHVEQFHIANEELKSANEEAMSVNEELQATNEELESSKEELQSLNEELTTVNAELGRKVDELQSANDDLSNLLNSTDLATLCLDRDFTIRWFTPATGRLIRVLETDLGRPFSDLTHAFTDASLLDDARAVLDGLVPIAREVSTTDGRWFMRRTTPYCTADNRIVGVVITFADITAQREARVQVEALNERIERSARAHKELLSFVQDVAATANQATTLAQVARGVLRQVCEQTGWCAGRLVAPSASSDGDLETLAWWCPSPGPLRDAIGGQTRESLDDDAGHLLRAVLADGRPRHTAPLEGCGTPHLERLAACGAQESVAFAVRAGEATVAAIELFARTAKTRDDRLLDVLDAVGIQLGHAIHRIETADRVATAAEQMRVRLGQELHDSLGQDISAIALLVEGLRADLERTGSPHSEAMERLTDTIARARRRLRALLHGHLPETVHADGLPDALRALADRAHALHGVRCMLDVGLAGAVRDDETATHLYRIAQEAVHNALKHGRPSEIRIELAEDDDTLTLRVRDDGVGLPPDAARRGRGLEIMRHRARSCGASFTAAAAAEGGTVVVCRVPMGTR
ncbi:MAG: PAS domain-containing protein [Myxococcales bacterium]|nr:PAS domain-containing protein [Myxococcales bacterium]